MPAPPERTEHPSLARIGTFSDGVFAIGITLLVLAIRIPHPTDADADRGLLSLLTEQWRSYLAFVLSFMVVGINWANHRVMFKTFASADNTLVWLNLVYLMVAVVFIPVPTAVLGAWLGDPRNEVVAAVFYGAVGAAGGLLYVLLWWYGAYVAKLTEINAQQRRALTIAWAPAPLVVALLTAVAFVSPTVAVAGYVAIVLVYVLPVPRLVALAQRRRRAPSSRRR
jgi:uncharacterized membrane protein